jgi:hypothetical protein
MEVLPREMNNLPDYRVDTCLRLGEFTHHSGIPTRIWARLENPLHPKDGGDAMINKGDKIAVYFESNNDEKLVGWYDGVVISKLPGRMFTIRWFDGVTSNVDTLVLEARGQVTCCDIDYMLRPLYLTHEQARLGTTLWSMMARLELD